MVKLTMIARVLDGLPLAEGLDTDASLDLEYYKQQAKTLFKKLGQNSSYSSGAGGAPPSRMSYESGEYFMHYVIESGVCYLTLCERNYPKKLAYSYLEGESKQNSFLFFAYSIRLKCHHVFIRDVCLTHNDSPYVYSL
jgi:vesicle transport protein SEC22